MVSSDIRLVLAIKCMEEKQKTLKISKFSAFFHFIVRVQLENVYPLHGTTTGLDFIDATAAATIFFTPENGTRRIGSK